MAGRRSRIKLTPKLGPRIADKANDTVNKVPKIKVIDGVSENQGYAEDDKTTHNEFGDGCCKINSNQPDKNPHLSDENVPNDKDAALLEASNIDISVDNDTQACDTVNVEGMRPPEEILESSSLSNLTPEDVLHLQKCRNKPYHRKKFELSSDIKKWSKDFQRKVESKSLEDNMIMRDLIYHIPTSNPMISNNLDVALDNLDEAELVDDVGNPDENLNESVPVPQVTVGSDGQIIIDEQSLVIETSANMKAKSFKNFSNLVYDSGNSDGSYRLKQPRKCKRWTVKETERFYKALTIIGTDFTLMSSVFPGRNRLDLKNKFKNELKYNSHLVDKAVHESFHFDPEGLSEESDTDVDDPFFLENSNVRQCRVKNKLWANDSTNTTESTETVSDNIVTESSKKKGQDQTKRLFCSMEFDLDEPVPNLISNPKSLMKTNKSSPTRKRIKKSHNICKGPLQQKPKTGKKRKAPKVAETEKIILNDDAPESNDCETSGLQSFLNQHLGNSTILEEGISLDGNVYLVAAPETEDTGEEIINVFLINPPSKDIGGYVIQHDTDNTIQVTISEEPLDLSLKNKVS